MNTRSLKTRTLLRAGAVLVILILLNIISVRIFGRIDMTANRQFTLADASKQLMRSLDDRVTIKAYFTEDLPSPYSTYRRALLDQLNEFRAYSNGNLQYEFINPQGEKTEREAGDQGVVQAQVQVVNEDKFEVKRAYMGLVFLYEDKKEVIPVIESITSLEYDISSTIKRLTTQTRKKIGFLEGEDEAPLSEFTNVQKVIGRQYDVTTVNLTTAGAVPDDIAALLVVAPKKTISPPVKYRIDQYIMRGGRVAFLLNRAEADLQQRFGQAVDNGLGDLLEQYSLRINADLVRDVQCANISIVQQQFGFSMQSQVPFPYLPLVSDFSKENMMVKDLKGVVLFFASSVDTMRVGEKGLKGEILMRSSKQSGRRREDEYYILDPLQRYTKADFTEQGIPLGAVVSGSFKSAFAGKPVPGDSTGTAPKPLEASPDTRVLLIGDGEFARDQYLGNRDNLTIFANIVDYLVDDAGLITIRSKEAALPPLEPVSDATKKFLKYGNMAVPPLLVLLFGLFRWRMKKARKRAMEAGS
jgi:gliding-associated putative ABC transporter substrate-binding component GldG